MIRWKVRTLNEIGKTEERTNLGRKMVSFSEILGLRNLWKLPGENVSHVLEYTSLELRKEYLG